MTAPVRCEQVLLSIARAERALREATEVMATSPLGLERDDPFLLLFDAARAALRQTVELEGSAAISDAIRRRLFAERDLVDSLPPLHVMEPD